jgi:Tol biopolymer transport system component
MTVQEGALLCGRYRLQESVGRGGMADVYLAFDGKRQAPVAVKILREDLAEDPDFVRRFRREAEALAQLDHPNIVHFYAFEQDGLVAFIVMDYIAGTTLRRRLQECRGPLEVKELTPILRDVCSALHYAHVNGFVHRDLKPGNVMLKRDGTALLTDFGISRAVEGATLTAAVMGTPAYMSPEQIEGGPVDTRSDIYSLGVLLFEMATGRRPFTGDEPGLTQSGTTTRVQQAHLRLPPPEPRSLNPKLPAAASAVILRALAKRPADRWPDVMSLREAWEAAVGAAGAGFAGAGAAAATPARISPPAARRQFPGWMLALVAVALLAIAAVLFLVFRAPREREVAAQVTAPALTPVIVQAGATAPSSIPPPTAKPAQQRGGVVQLASRGPSATASPAPTRWEATATVPIVVTLAPTSIPSPITTATLPLAVTLAPTSIPSPMTTATPITPSAVVGKVVFGSDRSGFAHIFTVRGNGQGLRAITGGNEYFWDPVWSNDGTLVAYASKLGGNTEVFVARSDGGNARPISNHPAEDDHPSWFPGNGELAFASRRDGGWEIYRMNADGSNVRRLTADGGDNRFAAVSPDGAQIAYVSQNAGYPGIDLMLMNADGGNRRAVFSFASRKQRDEPGRYLFRPDWSPDGTQIAFGADDDGDGLISVVVINRVSGQAKRLIQDGNSPAWSPDGARLIYKPAGERQILFVADTAGNQLYQLTASNYNAWSPDWAR